MRRVSRKPNKTKRRDRTRHVHVRRAPGRNAEARVAIGCRVLRAAIGPSGIGALKREGDGATPRGVFPIRTVLWRADRGPRPVTRLAARPIRRSDGWCDAAADRNYNRRVKLPYPASAEHLWRDDHVYDLVVVLGANDMPRRRGCGSAIFLHLARPGYAPTEGCVAMARRDLLLALTSMRRGAVLRVTA